MNRLQKKCVVATAGFHLLLLAILIVGPAFFNPEPKTDNTQVLDVIPANLIDAAFSSGVKGATPPPPAPVVVPATQPPPPTPTLTERLERIFTPAPVKPVPETAEPQSHKIQINTQLVTRTTPKNSTTTDNSQQTAQTIKSAIRNLKKNLSPGTTIDMPGDSTVAYANYASVVKSIYDQAWTLPDSIANDDENVKVTVTIASDGTVVSARIIERADDAPVDASVQRTLDRVTFVAPFPEGSTDKQRTYTINFNPKAKRTLE